MPDDPIETELEGALAELEQIKHERLLGFAQLERIDAHVSRIAERLGSDARPTAKSAATRRIFELARTYAGAPADAQQLPLQIIEEAARDVLASLGITTNPRTKET